MAKATSETNLFFEAITRQWHACNRKCSESHSEKVLKSLESHVFPYIRLRDITDVKTPVLLIPIRAAESKEIYEIAARLQQRIAAVTRYAVQSGIWL